MSGDRVFLDTNVLIYLYSEDEDKKRDAAYKVVNRDCCLTSTQALNEASNVWYGKYNWNKHQIMKYLDGIEAVCEKVLLVQRETINRALNVKDRYGYSYFDSLMIASALDSGCSVLFSEDMSDGQTIEGQLRIINPFKGICPL